MSDLHLHFHGDIGAGATLVVKIPPRGDTQIPQALADEITKLGTKVGAVDHVVADLPPAPPQPPEN